LLVGGSLFLLYRVSIARGCRAYTMFVALCCRARQDEHCRENVAGVWPNRNGSSSRGKCSVQWAVLFPLRWSCDVPVSLWRKIAVEKCLALIQLYKSIEVLWDSVTCPLRATMITSQTSGTVRDILGLGARKIYCGLV
jgi:hypothetical protein